MHVRFACALKEFTTLFPRKHMLFYFSLLKSGLSYKAAEPNSFLSVRPPSQCQPLLLPNKIRVI